MKLQTQEVPEVTQDEERVGLDHRPLNQLEFAKVADQSWRHRRQQQIDRRIRLLDRAEKWVTSGICASLGFPVWAYWIYPVNRCLMDAWRRGLLPAWPVILTGLVCWLSVIGIGWGASSLCSRLFHAVKKRLQRARDFYGPE